MGGHASLGIRAADHPAIARVGHAWPDFRDHEDRNQRQRHAITVLLRHLSPPPADLDDTADLLTAMTSFEAYETLAANGRHAEAAAQLISAATRRLLA